LLGLESSIVVSGFGIDFIGLGVDFLDVGIVSFSIFSLSLLQLVSSLNLAHIYDVMSMMEILIFLWNVTRIVTIATSKHRAIKDSKCGFSPDMEK